MAPHIIKIQHADDIRDVVHHAVEAIAGGKIVALPTESGFGLAASALSAEAVERLAAIQTDQRPSPIAFALKSLDDAIDFVPNINPIARRIARRSWPGPIALVVPSNHQDSVVHRLCEPVKQVTLAHGWIALRSPASEISQQVLRLCAGPVVLKDVNLTKSGESNAADQVLAQFGQKVDLILDGGDENVEAVTTVIQVFESGKIAVVQEGSVDAETVNRLANFVGLVVCTGNTCRSPMAEALFKKLVAEKVGCDADQLIEKGIQIASAGIAAMPGAPAAEQATTVMKKFGMEIGDHASQPVSDLNAQAADLILTMTNGHRDALISYWPMLEPRTKTLRVDGGDISDPIGRPVAVYESCAEQIEQNLRHWVDQIDWSQFNKNDH
jgi:protein-tyrosine phosphatase